LVFSFKRRPDGFAVFFGGRKVPPAAFEMTAQNEDR